MTSNIAFTCGNKTYHIGKHYHFFALRRILASKFYDVNLASMINYGGKKQWHFQDMRLVSLLNHSDCSGQFSQYESAMILSVLQELKSWAKEAKVFKEGEGPEMLLVYNNLEKAFATSATSGNYISITDYS